MYQYKLEFQLEYKWLPRNLDKLCVSFFKASAQASAQEFYEQLYNKNQSVMKGFTYSCFLPGAKFCKEKIVLDRTSFSILFSSIKQEELYRFFNGFQKMKFKRYPIGGNTMQLVSVVIQQLQEIRENEIVIKMQSPLIVREHCQQTNADVYFTCEMDGFDRVLKDNITLFFDRMGMQMELETFAIQIVKGKKIVVPVFDRNTDASIGIFKLAGSCALLNNLYLAGMGSRRSEGHGKFDVIG